MAKPPPELKTPEREKFAFPVPSGLMVERGMTLRDYFAGQYIMGIAANLGEVGMFANLRAKAAYTQADAMLEARTEEPGE